MELCRCCYYKTSIESSKNILLESYNDIKFVDVLNKIANITISENDEFPKRICHQCYEIFLFICDFITLVTRTDNRFHKKINDETMDTDSIVDKSQSEINETSNDVEEIISEVDVVGDYFDAQNDRSNCEQDTSENVIVIDDGDSDDDDDIDDNSRTDKNKSEDLYKNNNKSGGLDKLRNCPICNKYFPVPYKVKRHMGVHNRPIKCRLCDKICLGAEAYKDHTMMHNELTFKCIKCSNIYRHKRSLKKHLISVHNLAMCNICCETFQLNQIDAHLLNHTEQKSYNCKVCQHSTDNERMFNKHLKQHYKDGVFGCHVCGKRFPRMYNLNRHLQSKIVHKSTK